MKYLVIGSGGREHTLAWRLLHDGSAREVFVLPGNGGIQEKYCIDIPVNKHTDIAVFCVKNKIDVVVVGPEAPLADGLVDFLTAEKIPAFGPTRLAARLESSKLFAKEIMEKYGVPTAGYREFRGKDRLVDHVMKSGTYPMVIKLDGLAAGKGVGIPANRDEALAFIEENVREDTKVFVEDFIDGEEASVLGVCDGDHVHSFIAAQDHKRVFDGDRGPNTGGMGAYAPAPVMTSALLKRVQEEVLLPTVRGMKNEGLPFKGILYAGIIVKGNNISVLEFNVRFGDPEAQVILPLLKGKLGDVIDASINGTLNKMKLEFLSQHAITVVMASGGYPGDYQKGKKIRGLDTVAEDIMVFHAGTRRSGEDIVTNGGRVLNVTCLGDTLRQARDLVYEEIGKISFDGCFYRKDIAHRAL